MDANGTRFHLLQGESDWSRGRTAEGEPVSESSRRVRWNAQRHEVTLEPKTFRFVAGKGDRPVSLNDRRGAARDRFGNWYWIAPDRQSILVRSAGSGNVSAFWPPDESDAPADGMNLDGGEFRSIQPLPATPLPLQGLAVTEDHYLVAGTTQPAGVLIFDLYSGGPPRQRSWSADVASAFEPFALTAREGGGVWILGRGDKRVWELDRRFGLALDYPSIPPSPQEGRFTSAAEPERVPDAPLRWDRSKLGWAIPAADPIAIVTLPGRGVLVLDRTGPATAAVHWLERRASHDTPMAAEPFSHSVIALGSAPAKLAAHDFAFGARDPEDPEEWSGRLFIADGDGNQAYPFAVRVEDDRLTLTSIAQYFPMRLFGGRALVGVDAEPWYDCGDSWVKLVHQNRPRYEEMGELTTPVLDSGEPGCVWHRLMLDGCIPPGAEVDVYTRSSDDWRELTLVEWLSEVERRALGAPDAPADGDPETAGDLAEWQREPRPYLRGDGPELAYLPRELGDGRGTWELLLQRARGRYLQAKLVLRGDGRSTPRLRALRAWYPRFSYLDKYLPAVYREDAQSASFLDRFLANLEGMFTTVEERIAAAQMLFDVDSVPPESLGWLGRWFGVALDPSWEDDRRRLFLRHAMDFFTARGTIRGLQLALRLALDECVDERLFEPSVGTARRAAPVRIIERFRARRTARALLGDVETGVPAPGPQRLDPAVRWQPSSGAAELHRRYREALKQSAGSELPMAAAEAPPGWREFVLGTLGFEPRAGASERAGWHRFLRRKYPSDSALATAHGSAGATLAGVRLPRDAKGSNALAADWHDFLADTPSRERRLWQDFLARRYRTVGPLNDAWRTRWSGFAAVPLPDTVPASDAPLADWFEFEGTVLEMHRTAHRFTVMLPIPLHMRVDTPAQRRRLALARAVLDLEKPAHTVFDMRFYWAMFRVGEARIGDDTVVGQGSRAPELMAPMVLGEGYLAEGFLAAHWGREAPARLQTGRDRVGKSARLGGP